MLTVKNQSCVVCISTAPWQELKKIWRKTPFTHDFLYFLRNTFKYEKISTLNLNPLQIQHIFSDCSQLHLFTKNFQNNRAELYNVAVAENTHKNKWWRVLWNQNKFLCYLKQSTLTIHTWAYPLRKMINRKTLTKITEFLDENLSDERFFFKTRMKYFSRTVTLRVHQFINLKTWTHAKFQSYHLRLPHWQATGHCTSSLIQETFSSYWNFWPAWYLTKKRNERFLITTPGNVTGRESMAVPKLHKGRQSSEYQDNTHTLLLIYHIILLLFLALFKLRIAQHNSAQSKDFCHPLY